MPSEPVWDEAAIKAAAETLMPLTNLGVTVGYVSDGDSYGIYVSTDAGGCRLLRGGFASVGEAAASVRVLYARLTVAAYFAALDREALIEPFDGLLEALERVDYEGQIGDVEDVDGTRADAIAALPRLRAALGLIPTEGGDHDG